MSNVPASIRTLAIILGCAAAAALTALILSATISAPPASAIPPGGAKTRPNGAKIKLHSSKVKRGRTIRVSGSNWRAKDSLRSPGRKVVTIKLNDGATLAILPIRNRRFSGSVPIPRRVAPGRYWLRFLASKPRTSVRSKRFRVTR